jgi:hypothetical protein
MSPLDPEDEGKVVELVYDGKTLHAVVKFIKGVAFLMDEDGNLWRLDGSGKAFRLKDGR